MPSLSPEDWDTQVDLDIPSPKFLLDFYRASPRQPKGLGLRCISKAEAAEGAAEAWWAHNLSILCMASWLAKRIQASPETITELFFKTTFTMASKGLTDEGITFPATITPPASNKSLILIGDGVTDMTIETILVKFSAIAVYVEPEIARHMQAWKGKPASELVAEDSSYFTDFVDAPVQKLVKVEIIKGIRGSAYAGGLESSIRDRLAYHDKYEEEEDAALEQLVKYLSAHNLPAGTSVFFHWPSPSVVQVTVSPDGSIPKQFGNSSDNENLATFLLHWLIGANAVSESTALSTAAGVAAL